MLRPAQRRLVFLTTAFALSLLSCGREVIGPDDGISVGRRIASIAIAPEMPALMQVVEGAGDAVPFTKVRVVLRNGDGSIAKDTMVDFPSDADFVSLALQLPIPITAPDSGLPLSLTMAYVNATGDTVFRGGPSAIVARPVGSSGANVPVVIPVTYDGAGKDAASLRIIPKTGTGIAGTQRVFIATAFDAQLAPIANTPFVFYTLDSTRVQVNGVTGVATWRPVRGNARIVAALPNGNRADTATFLVTLPASKLVIGTGNLQTGAVNAALADSLVVRTLASDDVPVAGVIVNFAVASGGGSVSTVTDTSDINGNVSTKWTLGAALDAQTITATAAGLSGSPLTIGATAVPSTPTRLEIVSQPSVGVAGAALTPAIVVRARDAFGNIATTFTGAVSIAITGAQPPPLGGTAVRAAQAGAVFNDLSINVAGSYQLAVASGTLVSDTTAAIGITAAPASVLAFVAQPTATVAGASFVPPVTVRALDAFGNRDSSFTGSISLDLLDGGSAVLSGGTSQLAVNGLATFPTLSVNLASAAYRLRASSGSLTPDTSVVFGITPSAPTQISLISGGSQTSAVGSTLSQPIVVELRDAQGNAVPGATVNFSIVTGGGTALPTNATTNALGRASTVWTLGGFLGAQELRASLATAPTVLVPVPATATPGAPAQVLITQAPTTGVAGNALPSFLIEVRDVGGNRIPTFTGSVVASLDANPTGTALSGALAVNAVAGLADFSGLIIYNAGVGYRLKATLDVEGISSPASAPFNVVAGAASTLAFVSGQIQGGTAGEPMPEPIVVQVKDAHNNPVAGQTVNFAALVGAASVSPTAVVTDATGRASTTAVFGSTAGNPLAGVQISSTGIATVLETTVSIAAGAATQLAVTTVPFTTVVAGAPFTIAAEARDALGNRAPTFGGGATVEILTGPSGASLSGPRNDEALAGALVFENLSVDKAGSYTLSISSAGLTSATTFAFSATPAAAASMTLVDGDAQSGAVTSTLAKPLVVEVRDAFGNPIEGVSVVWAVGSGDANVTIGTVLTDANGISQTELVLGTTVGPVTVTASVVGLPMTSFSATVTAGTASVVAEIVAPMNATAGSAFGTFTYELRDGFGNVVTSHVGFARAVFQKQAGSADPVVIGGDSVTVVNGIATFSNLIVATAGQYRIVANFGDGLFSAPSAPFTISPAGASVLAKVDGDAQSAVVTNALPLPLRVRVTDAYGNGISGITVNFNGPEGRASFVDPSPVTDGAGIAEGFLTLGDSAIVLTLGAFVEGLIPESVLFTATALPDAASGFALIRGDAQTAPSGAAATDSVVVRVKDGYGNNVPGVTVTFTSFDDVTFSISSVTSDSLGLAATRVIGGASLGLKTFAAEAVGASPISLTVTVVPGAPAAIDITSAPIASTTAGITLNALTAVVRDAATNQVSSYSDSLEVSIQSGPPGATLSGTTRLHAPGGIASFIDLSVDKAGDYSLRVSRGALLADTTETFSVTAGAPAAIAFVSGNNQNTAVLGTTADSLVVRVVDAYGNDVAGQVVSWTVTAGSAFVPSTAVTGSDGEAWLFAIMGSGVESNTVEASVTGLSGSPVSFTLQSVAGAVAQLAVQSLVPSETADAISAITVLAQDAQGNAVASFVGEVTASIASGPAGASLGGDLVLSATAGTVTFSNLSLPVAGEYTLEFAAAGLTSATSNAFTIFPAAAASLSSFAGGLQVDSVFAYSDTLKARVTDVFGNGVGGVAVSWAVRGNGSITYQQNATDAQGIARAGIRFGNTVDSVVVTATSGELSGSPITFALRSVPAPVNELNILSAPTSIASPGTGAVIEIEAVDAYGNRDTTFTGIVTLLVPDAPPGSTVGGTLNVAAVNGLATFNAFTVDLAGLYTFNAQSGALTAANVFVTVVPGDAANLSIVSGDTQTGLATLALTSPLVVLVTDAAGNPIAGDTVVFVVTSGAGTLGADTVVTDGEGNASSTWTLGAALGSQTVQASAAGTTPVTFTATALELPKLSVSTSSVSSASVRHHSSSTLEQPQLLTQLGRVLRDLA